MKKIFIIIAICWFLLSCSNQSNTSTTSTLHITSPVENQVARAGEFRIENIWLEYCNNDNKQTIIATKDMISRKDLNKLNTVGEHNITIKYEDSSTNVKILIYDKQFLNDNVIYCLDDNKTFLYANNIYNLEIPTKENLYFYNWYIDENLTTLYDEENKKTVNTLYAKWSKNKTYRVRFYNQNILLKEEYVEKGGSATPPIIKSYHDYSFFKWDKSFTNIQGNTDIYAQFVEGYFEVVFYDGANNILKRELVPMGQDATPPELTDAKDKYFIGWDNSYTNVTSNLYLYPVYAEEDILYSVKFYFNKIDESTLLYEEFVEPGGSLVFNYEVEKYKFISLDQDITNITKNLEVIATYEENIMSFYIDDVLYYQGYVFPTITDDMVTYFKDFYTWVKDENIDNRYNLELNIDNDITLVTKEFQELNVGLIDFLSIGIHEYLGYINNVYCYYDWYYDENYTMPIEVENLSKKTIYGKPSQPTDDQTSYMFNIDEYQTDNQNGYILSTKVDISNQTVFIPKTYKGKEIIAINYDFLNQAKILFIPSSVREFVQDNFTYNQAEYYIVDEANPKFFSVDGILYHYQDSNNIELYIYPLDNKNKTYTIPNFVNSIFQSAFMYSYDKCYLQNIYLDDGIIEFNSLNLIDCNLYLPDSLTKIEYICITNGTINTTSNSKLEYLNGYINNAYFTFPKSLKYFCGNFENITVADDHPYFNYENYLLTTKDKLTIVGISTSAPTYSEFVIPKTAKYLFFSCFDHLKCNTLIFHDDLEWSFICNGISYYGNTYYNFNFTTILNIQIPSTSQLPFIQSLIYTDWFQNSKDTELYFGSYLCKIYNAAGDENGVYKISEDCQNMSEVYIDDTCTMKLILVPKKFENTNFKFIHQNISYSFY